MTQLDVVGATSGDKHEYHYLNNTYGTSDRILFGQAGWFDVELENVTSTNVTVSLWCEDTEANGPVSDTGTFPVAPNTTVVVQVSGFPARADGSPMEECDCHLLLHNDDSESTGVEIWSSFYY